VKLRLVRGGADDRSPVVSQTAPRLRSRLPVVRSGTSLEVAELAWIAEGVSRELALTIPSVVACRNLLVGTTVQLGLFRYRAGERLDPGYLLTKPDPSTTRPATIGGTVDDLIFEGRAYWRVLERDSEGVPTRARWTPVVDVTPRTSSSGGTYSVLTGYDIAGVDGVVAVADVIRFDSPIPGVLIYGARTLAAAIELELAARRLAAVELPAGTLTNEGAELSDDEARTVVADFQAARRDSGIAWLQGVRYTREELSPADLQLVEARANVATDVARLFNVPVAMIGASPSGNASALLYSNLSQQLAILVSSAVAPHLHTIEATLSDVLPRGQSVAFDVQTFLRSDPQAAAEYAIDLLTAGIIGRDEARALLAIPSQTANDLTPGRV
jgi:phage portal protein BeeE